MEEQGEANLMFSVRDKQHLCFLLLKDPFREQFLCCHYLIGHLLICRKLSDEAEDQGAVFFAANLKVIIFLRSVSSKFRTNGSW